MLIDYYYRDLIYIQSLTLFNVRLRWIADVRPSPSLRMYLTRIG